jgi:hypothetical protein
MLTMATVPTINPNIVPLIPFIVPSGHRTAASGGFIDYTSTASEL